MRSFNWSEGVQHLPLTICGFGLTLPNCDLSNFLIAYYGELLHCEEEYNLVQVYMYNKNIG